MSGDYHYTIGKLAKKLSHEVSDISYIQTKLGAMLDDYRSRLSGGGGYAYDSNGLKYWEQIVLMRRKGQGPKAIETALLKVLKSNETSEEAQAPREPISRAGGEVVSREHYEEVRKLKDDLINEKEKVIESRDREIRSMQAFLPAGRSLEEHQAAKAQVKAQIGSLILELEKLPRWGSKRRRSEIIQALRNLNYNS